MPTKVIFSFDSEDYITPEAADAEKWWAETMSKHGITACVCVVAELARQLHETGRWDVLEAWEKHEIAYHTDFHSRPPTPAQYLDPCGWKDGIAEAMAREGKGIDDLAALTGQHPSAFCKPGSSWGPQICAAMDRMGVPVFCDSPFLWDDPARPMWYAGQLLLYYHIHFDGYFDEAEGRLERMKRDFEERLSRHDGGYLIMYTHPCRLVTADFWDGVNFNGGANHPRDRWRPAPLRPPEQVTAMARDFDVFLGWVAAHPEVELTTYRQLYAEYKEPPARGVDGAEVLGLLNVVFGGDPAAYTDAVVTGDASYSPAETLGLCAALYTRKKGDGLPPVPLRRLLGPSEAPPELAEPIAVQTDALKDALRAADRFMSETGRIPASVSLGDREIGPGTLLRALNRLLKEEMETGGRSPERVTLQPGPELPVFAQNRRVAGMKFQGNWVVYPPEFTGENVIRQAQLQTWSAKPAVSSS
ncbi:MAG: hypothetical protein KY468_04815 [Armatimonadetes bacterium]|nr:hypothetical protein [Armatimonadota bacterium]